MQHIPHICDKAGTNTALPVKQTYSLGLVRCLRRQRCLLSSLITWVQSPEPLWWQERADSYKLSSDLYKYPVAGQSFHKIHKQCNKSQHSLHNYSIYEAIVTMSSLCTTALLIIFCCILPLLIKMCAVKLSSIVLRWSASVFMHLLTASGGQAAVLPYLDLCKHILWHSNSDGMAMWWGSPNTFPCQQLMFTQWQNQK